MILLINAVACVLSCKEMLSEMIEIEPHFKFFIIVDISLYVAWFIYIVSMSATLTLLNAKFWYFVPIFINFLAYINAQWAYVLTFSDELDVWKDEFDNPVKLQKFKYRYPNGRPKGSRLKSDGTYPFGAGVGNQDTFDYSGLKLKPDD